MFAHDAVRDSKREVLMTLTMVCENMIQKGVRHEFVYPMRWQ